MKKLLILATMLASFTVAFSQDCPCMSDEELITNGDFESGLAGYSTDFSPGISFLTASYMVTNYTENKIPFTSEPYCHDYDHTIPGPVGNLFAFQTTNGPTVKMLEQTVNIEPFTDYCFSIWTFKVKDNNSPDIRVTLTDGVNTVLIDNNIDFDDCSWIQTTVSFNSGVLSGPCQLTLDDYSNSNSYGALDDISLHKEIDETDLPTIIPDVVCKDDDCVILTEGLPGEFSASGPGVESVLDIWGNEFWRFCPSEVGIGVYTITICISGSPDCCVDVEIEVAEPDLGLVPTEYCTGTSSLLVNPSFGGAWSGDFVFGGPVNFFFSPPTEGIYTLTWMDSYGCTASIDVEVFGAPITVVEVTEDCGTGGSMTLSSGDGTLYDWSISGPVIDAASGLAEVTFNELPSGTYWVSSTMVDAPYCSSWITVEITEGSGEWPKTTSNTHFEDHAVDVCNDLSGNTFMTGDFLKETSFDALTIDYLNPQAGIMYVASYDPCGDLRFVATAFGENVTASRIAIDTDYERIYVVGTFSGTTTFVTGVDEGGTSICGAADITITSGTNQGAFVASYDTDGCLLHVEKIDAPAGSFLEGEAIAASDHVDTWLGLDHRVYFATKQTPLGGGSGAQLRVYACTPNPVSPFNLTYSWMENITSMEDAWINDMDNQNGHIAIVGSFQNNLLHDVNLLSVSDFKDGFAYNWVDGGLSQFTIFEKDLFTVSTSIQHGEIFTLTMENNRIFVGGEYAGPIPDAFGGLSLPLPSPNPGAVTGFVARLNFGGVPMWINSVSSEISASVKSMDSKGNLLFIGGEYSGNNYYENGLLEETAISGNHTFISHWMQPSGPAGLWTNVSSAAPSATAITTNTGLTYFNDYVYATGDYIGLMDFDLTSVGPLNSSPLIFRNAYLWRLEDEFGEAKVLSSQTENTVSKSTMLIYPNPANADGGTTIEVTNTDLSIYEIISATGEQLRSGSFKHKVNLNLNGLSAGMYFVQVTNSSGVEIGQIVIK